MNNRLCVCTAIAHPHISPVRPLSDFCHRLVTRYQSVFCFLSSTDQQTVIGIFHMLNFFWLVCMQSLKYQWLHPNPTFDVACQLQGLPNWVILTCISSDWLKLPHIPIFFRSFNSYPTYPHPFSFLVGTAMPSLSKIFGTMIIRLWFSTHRMSVPLNQQGFSVISDSIPLFFL